jgi:hypothetical protein
MWPGRGLGVPHGTAALPLQIAMPSLPFSSDIARGANVTTLLTSKANSVSPQTSTPPSVDQPVVTAEADAADQSQGLQRSDAVAFLILLFCAFVLAVPALYDMFTGFLFR